jgi:hypothetical protein
MKNKVWFWLLALMLAVSGLLVACDEFDEEYYEDEDSLAYYDEGEEEYDDDEYYEDEDEYYEDEEGYYEDEEGYYEDEEGYYDEDGNWWDWEEMTAEDCYDDEYYDEEDQMCYLLYDCEEDEDACEELDDAFYILAGELISLFESDDREWTEGAPDEVIIRYEIRENELINP